MESNLKIYEITHRESGVKSFQAAITAGEACKQAGWLIGDCYVIESRTKIKTHDKGDPDILVKIPCNTCSYQYAECTKPENEVCPCRSDAPELAEWLKQAATAHLCNFVGEELLKTDHQLGRKWVKMETAIRESTSKS